MPKRYFQNGKFGDELRISGAALKDTILSGVSACHACVIACGRVVRLEDGEKRKGPEYETLVGFGPNLGLNDAVLVTRLNEICDRYGLDTISMSNIIGLAFRLYELGVITEKDTGGLALNWGESRVVEPLIHMTVNREGIGAYLAQGAHGFGEHFNAEEEVVQVNGLEVAYHDPRGSSGMALVYATSPRGACHNQSDFFIADIGQIESSIGMSYVGRLNSDRKALNVAIHQNWRTLFNSLVMCIFVNLEPETILGLINSACGLNWIIDDMLQAGERGWNLKRAINNRLGLRRENDTLPKPLLKPQADADETERFVPDLDKLLKDYYQVRGWDHSSGYPSREKLLELSLDFVLEDLYPPGASQDTEN